MMTSSNGNTFRVTGHGCGEFPGHRRLSPHTVQWRRSLMFSLIFIWINSWVNKRGAGDLIRYCTHYDVNAMTHLGSQLSLLPFAEMYMCVNSYIWCRAGANLQAQWNLEGFFTIRICWYISALMKFYYTSCRMTGTKYSWIWISIS